MVDPRDGVRISRLLIVRLSSMGDVIHSLPAAQALRAAFPNSTIGWLIEERWAELLCAPGTPPQEQVLGNLSVLIAHRQVVPDSAELIASIAGTRGAWRVSRHSDCRTTRTRNRAQTLEPDSVMGLGRGWAAVLVLGNGASARITRMFSPGRGR